MCRGVPIGLTGLLTFIVTCCDPGRLSVQGAVLSQIPAVTIAPGVNMPVISLGSGGGSESLNVTEYTRLWLSLGGRGIDSAWVYKDQDRVSAGIEASGVPRSKLFITSKTIGQSYDEVLQQVQEDLKQLRTDYIDLMLLHFPVAQPAGRGCWRALEDLHKKGVLKAIGVSNFMVADLKELLLNATVIPAVNQNKLYIGYHGGDRARDFCHAHNITYEAYSPLAKGEVLKLPEVVTIAQTHNRSPAQVALKFVVQRGDILTVQSHSSAHDQDNMDIFSFELTDDEMATLSKI